MAAYNCTAVVYDSITHNSAVRPVVFSSHLMFGHHVQRMPHNVVLRDRNGTPVPIVVFDLPYSVLNVGGNKNRVLLVLYDDTVCG